MDSRSQPVKRPHVVGELIEMIAANLAIRFDHREIEGDTPLFADGLELDSFDIVELITLVEAAYDVEFDEADFQPEYFRDINALASLVERYANG